MFRGGTRLVNVVATIRRTKRINVYGGWRIEGNVMPGSARSFTSQPKTGLSTPSSILQEKHRQIADQISANESMKPNEMESLWKIKKTINLSKPSNPPQVLENIANYPFSDIAQAFAEKETELFISQLYKNGKEQRLLDLLTVWSSSASIEWRKLPPKELKLLKFIINQLNLQEITRSFSSVNALLKIMHIMKVDYSFFPLEWRISFISSIVRFDQKIKFIQSENERERKLDDISQFIFHGKHLLSSIGSDSLPAEVSDVYRRWLKAAIVHPSAMTMVRASENHLSDIFSNLICTVGDGILD